MRSPIIHAVSGLIALLLLGLAPETERRLVLPSYGIAVDVPEGYQRRAERSIWEALALVRLGPDGTSVHQFSVQVARPTQGTTLREMAERSSGGRELRAAKWGGLDALESVGDTKTARDGWYSARLVFVEYEGLHYNLAYSTLVGGEDLDVYRRVVETSVFSPRVGAGSSIKPRASPTRLGGGLTVDLPDPFRLDRNASNETTRVFRAYDFEAGKSALAITLATVPPDGKPRGLEAAIAQFPIEQFGGTRPQFSPVDGVVDAVISTPFTLGEKRVCAIAALAPDGTAYFFLISTESVKPTADDSVRVADMVARSLALVTNGRNEAAKRTTSRPSKP